MSVSKNAGLFGVLLLGAALLVACTSETSGATTTTTPELPPALEDGEYFAFVTVGTDETEAFLIGVDIAELLSGEEARQAAIDAGEIGEDEELPNDVYILNPESRYELLGVGEGTQFDLISGEDVNQRVLLNIDAFADVYNGGDMGQPLYGVVAGVPIPMELVVESGLITAAEQVYLP